ncbi:hypothetical protein ACO2Q8_09105 [Larkinella sp. VNQ87]|uniref:hypothetical protein n=1 Tax=Larkinella sp. VNQ87 TaxID=3400921 RepID=UPI003C072EA3
MLYVLWAIVNIGLFIFFVKLCFQATRLLREKSGILASVVFVVGLASVVRYSGSNAELTAKSNREARKSKMVAIGELVPGTLKQTYILLAENPVSTLSLGVLYGKDTSAYKTAIYDAFSSRTGFTSGF